MGSLPIAVALLLGILVLVASVSSGGGGSGREEIARAKAVEKKRAKQGASSECVKWGSQFAVPLDGKNVEMSCRSPAGRPVCCVAMSDDLQERGVGFGMEDAHAKDGANKLYTPYTVHGEEEECVITKEYRSSPQELREFQAASRISKIGATELQAFKDNGEREEVDSGTRLPLPVHTRRMSALLSYVTSPESVRNSSAWLGRVSVHMASEAVPQETAADSEFLSRFIFTKTCGGRVVKQWNEWIEPLTVVARHPFGFGNCRPAFSAFEEAKAPRKPRSDVDYVLLKSGRQLAKGEAIATKRPRKHLMFDAGTSTFDSSLYWFTCAYSQRKVAFDSVYGWEMTTLNPQEYWEKVPPKWLPHWHFYNTPISNDHSAPHSPVRIIKQVATKDDFVAFKLDIDHSPTEMPVAMDLLRDSQLSSLVDEFFFELHFRCEIMTSCGWGKRVPYEEEGLLLERADVLHYFLQLRQKGIRAHIWP